MPRRYFDPMPEAIAAIGKSAGKSDAAGAAGHLGQALGAPPALRGGEARAGDERARAARPRPRPRGEAASTSAFTIDAEEADRLELSLEVIAAVAADASLAGWDGFGLAVQAYQKRAPAVIDWVDRACDGARPANDGTAGQGRLLGHRGQARAGARPRGLPGLHPEGRDRPSAISPARDSCWPRARASTRSSPRHNALTVATILEMAGDSDGFEFQRLHGMGEALYEAVRETEGVALPHLCTGRRPPRAAGLSRPPAARERRQLVLRRHRRRPRRCRSTRCSTRPADGARRRGAGAPRTDSAAGRSLRALTAQLEGHGVRPSPGARRASRRHEAQADAPRCCATRWPLRRRSEARARSVTSPIDGQTIVGTVVETPVELIDEVMARGGRRLPRVVADAGHGTRGAARPALRPARGRARLARRAARPRGRQDADDGVAEVREAVDFCRYYAAEARRALRRRRGDARPDRRKRRAVAGAAAASSSASRRGISRWRSSSARSPARLPPAMPSSPSPPSRRRSSLSARSSSSTRPAYRDAAAQLVPGDGQRRRGARRAPARGRRRLHRLDRSRLGDQPHARRQARADRAAHRRDRRHQCHDRRRHGAARAGAATTSCPRPSARPVSAARRSACSACRTTSPMAMLAMIAGAAAELTLGDPADPATDVGPVIDAEAKRTLEEHLAAMRGALGEDPAMRARRRGGSLAQRHLRRAAHRRARQPETTDEGGLRTDPARRPLDGRRAGRASSTRSGRRATGSRSASIAASTTPCGGSSTGSRSATSTSTAT